MKRVVCFLSMLIISTTAVSAQGVGNPGRGAEMARETCSRCHAVRGGDPTSPNLRAPTFAELASAPGMTVAALMVALTTPHAGMPMFVLNQEQREDIIAYILSLK
jgi:mono/diheme cytochrome c family protein